MIINTAMVTIAISAFFIQASFLFSELSADSAYDELELYYNRHAQIKGCRGRTPKPPQKNLSECAAKVSLLDVSARMGLRVMMKGTRK
jgi:hypothetical protein